MLNSRPSVETRGEPPRTRLLLEGFEREQIAVAFLVGIHDLADDHDLPLDGISVVYRE